MQSCILAVVRTRTTPLAVLCALGAVSIVHAQTSPTPAITTAAAPTATPPATTVEPAPTPPACVTLQGGTFTMGARDGDGEPEERPQHNAFVAPFCIERTEVTVAAYRACVDAGRCLPPGQHRPMRGDDHALCNWGRPGFDDHPVNCVNAAQAMAYCAWRGGNLPSEEQWEFAARGHSSRRFPWGNAPPTPGHANLCGTECGTQARQLGLVWTEGMRTWRDPWPGTAPVTALPAAGNTPEGLAGMAGNVWEWTRTPWTLYSDGHGYQGPDPNRRVIRGGGWSRGALTAARVTVREWRGVSYDGIVVGFRCVYDPR